MPDADASVGGRRREPLPIGRPGHAADGEGVPLEFAENGPSCRIPNQDSCVARRRSKLLPVLGARGKQPAVGGPCDSLEPGPDARKRTSQLKAGWGLLLMLSFGHRSRSLPPSTIGVNDS